MRPDRFCTIGTSTGSVAVESPTFGEIARDRRRPARRRKIMGDGSLGQ